MSSKVSPIVLFASWLLTGIFGYAQHAPITPDMLAGLRASRTINASEPIVTYSKNMELLEVDEVADNASVMCSVHALQKAFGIRISVEFHPSMPGDMRFSYSVTASERLVDALNNLVEATDQQICWRLLNGRIIVIPTPNNGQGSEKLATERLVQVNIDADDLYDAFLQLEDAYNEQHPDIPLIVYAPSYVSVQKSIAKKADNPALFVLNGEASLRSHILELLDQFGEPFSDYLCAVNIVSPDNIARAWDGPELWFYGLSFIFPKHRRIPQTAEEHLWVFEEGNRRRDRIERLFDRIEPGLLSYPRHRLD